MKNLKNYVKGINRWAKLFDDAEIDINNMDEEAAQRLFQKLEGDMSPENLTCDGELSSAQVNKKFRMLAGARKELRKLGYAPNYNTMGG